MDEHSSEFLMRVVRNALKAGMIEIRGQDRYCDACGNDLLYYEHEEDCPVPFFREMDAELREAAE